MPCSQRIQGDQRDYGIIACYTGRVEEYRPLCVMFRHGVAYNVYVYVQLCLPPHACSRWRYAARVSGGVGAVGLYGGAKVFRQPHATYARWALRIGAPIDQKPRGFVCFLRRLVIFRGEST